MAADSELSVKNGSDLLDRLIKDIVSESATSYVSIINPKQATTTKGDGSTEPESSGQTSAAFSLARFIPLLQERIFVVNPFTRMFLVSWISLLDSIPDLELVTCLPSFLGGLFRFLHDPNQDVVTATQHVLERFLEEIKHVAKVKKELAENRKEDKADRDTASINGDRPGQMRRGIDEANDSLQPENNESAVVDTDDERSSMKSNADAEEETIDAAQDEWVPGQDVQIDHPKILEILVTYLQESPGKI